MRSASDSASFARPAERWACWLQRQSGWRRAAIAGAAGAASALAMAPVHLWPVLFVTLPALVFLLDGVPRDDRTSAVRAAATIGWCFGFGYHLAGLYWIGAAFLVEAEVFAWLMPFAVLLMPSGLALFMAAATAASIVVWREDARRVVVLALALSGAEWLRGHVLTGFPWNVIGYALTEPLVFLQSVSVVGIYGLTLVTVLVAALPLVTLADPNATPRRRMRGLAAGAAVLGVMAIWGAWRLSEPLPGTVDGVHVRLVQPSIPQRDKWRPERQREFFFKHLALSATAPDGRIDDLAPVTHVVWPEAALPFQPLRSPEALALIGERLGPGRYLLAGALRSADEGGRIAAFNSLMLFTAQGVPALYDKIHLVPFGEYLPFQKTLESIGLEQLTRVRGGFSIGTRPRPLLNVPGLPPVGPLICYEAIFPAQVVQSATRPGVLVNVTNDGWFGVTSGPYQHLQQARARAVEEGLHLLRVANNGITASIDPYGRILAKIELNAEGTIDSAISRPLTLPIYARMGDIVFLIMCVCVFLTLIVGRNIKPRTCSAYSD